MHRKNLIIILGVLALISLVTTVAFARNSRFLEPPEHRHRLLTRGARG